MFGHDRGNGVLVALHGHGDDPASARSWGRGLAPPGWEVVAPGAPRDDEGVRSWFPTGARGVRSADLDAAVSRVEDVVARVRGAGRPVVVAGFSQGGAVAMALAARTAAAPGVGAAVHAVDAVVAICTFWPELADGDEPAPGGPGAPVLVVGTEHDEEVPAFLGQGAADHLRHLGLHVDSAVLPGAHRVHDGVQRHAASWLVDALHTGPKVSLGLPTDRVDAGSELVSGVAVAELSSCYERLGFHALYVTDHPAPDDRWLAAGGHHALDPAAALSAAAVATTTIRLHTNVYVLGYRNPFLAAKSLASVDVLSGGRLILGVAAGYLRPEFDALGTGFEDRADRLDEALEVLPRIWSGASVAGEGGGWSARGATVLPATVQQPRPPIWVGGNSTAAMRRAIRSGDGWSPFPTPAGARGLRTAEIADLDALRARLDRLEELREEMGRSEPLTICFVPFSLPGYLEDPARGLAPMLEELAALVELGVHWVALMVPGRTRAEVRERAGELSAALSLR